MAEDQKRAGIWLEVAEVRYETGGSGECSVLLRADREQPKPVWWPAADLSTSQGAFETYKAILNELDKKRVVLAWLTDSGPQPIATPIGGSTTSHWLLCKAFRFQSPELGGR